MKNLEVGNIVRAKLSPRFPDVVEGEVISVKYPLPHVNRMVIKPLTGRLLTINEKDIVSIFLSKKSGFIPVKAFKECSAAHLRYALQSRADELGKDIEVVSVEIP